MFLVNALVTGPDCFAIRLEFAFGELWPGPDTLFSFEGVRLMASAIRFEFADGELRAPGCRRSRQPVP